MPLCSPGCPGIHYIHSGVVNALLKACTIIPIPTIQIQFSRIWIGLNKNEIYIILKENFFTNPVSFWSLAIMLYQNRKTFNIHNLANLFGLILASSIQHFTSTLKLVSNST